MTTHMRRWLAADPATIWLRVMIAGAIAFVAGLAGLRWPLAVVLVLAMPSIWFHSLSVLVALPALVAMDRRDPLPSLWPLRPIARRGSTSATVVP